MKNMLLKKMKKKIFFCVILFTYKFEVEEVEFWHWIHVVNVK